MPQKKILMTKTTSKRRVTRLVRVRLKKMTMATTVTAKIALLFPWLVRVARLAAEASRTADASNSTSRSKSGLARGVFQEAELRRRLFAACTCLSKMKKFPSTAMPTRTSPTWRLGNGERRELLSHVVSARVGSPPQARPYQRRGVFAARTQKNPYPTFYERRGDQRRVKVRCSHAGASHQHRT